MSDEPGHQSTLNPAVMQEFRAQLSRAGSGLDPDTWASSVPARYGIAPRVRIRKSKWFKVFDDLVDQQAALLLWITGLTSTRSGH
jgi:hypothetical protein